jgi:ankyrin repeat protein
MTPEDETLLRAAATGDYMGATNSLGRGASVKAVDQDLWTPLHHATRRGDLPMIRLLIARGAETDAKTRDGNTLKGLAMMHNSEMLAALILAHHRADVPKPSDTYAQDAKDRKTGPRQPGG